MDCIKSSHFKYNDFSSNFSELLEQNKSVIIHHPNLQTLAIEIFKVKNIMAPELLRKCFPTRKAIIILKNSTVLPVEVLRLSCMAQELYLG